ncbi:TraR/DksA family transcriptional regulator [Sulfuriflexus mobilis]|uniref:TraR/DksA family transcriptional regulator n=1 Tax=Sulfuriflexus mobilis TaxID=1811807 RepID=UPI000F8267CF|nr:TraR/DksA family transcriptional regulator [Sulfuriflexus mobilis]
MVNRFPDPLDTAKQLEMEQRKKALDAHAEKVANDIADLPAPCHDDDGNRVCCSCTVVIPKARLEAQPESVFCVPCKEQWEAAR